MTDLHAGVMEILGDLDTRSVPSDKVLDLISEYAELESQEDWWLDKMRSGQIFDSCVWYATIFVRAGRPCKSRKAVASAI